MNDFFYIFKDLRKKKKITQKQLAEKTGLSQTFFVKIEKHNTVPNNENFLKICKALNLTYSELKELHIAYEKLIKPPKAEELILSNFADSEFIFEKLIENTIFHHTLLNIYKNAYNGNKYLVYYQFLSQIFFILECLKYDTLSINAEKLYLAIDITKEYSDRLFKISISEINASDDRFKILKAITKIVNHVRSHKSTFEFGCRKIPIRELLNNPDLIKSYEIPEILSNLQQTNSKPSNDEKIETLKKLIYELTSNNKFISKEGRYIYSNECSGFAKAVPICNDFFKYGYLISEIVFNNRDTVFIETNEGNFIHLNIRRLFDSIILQDIINSNISPIENRLGILHEEIKEIFDVIKDIIPAKDKDEKIQNILNSFILGASNLKYYLKIIKDKINERKRCEILLDEIQKENTALKIENEYLKAKIKELESAIFGNR